MHHIRYDLQLYIDRTETPVTTLSRHLFHDPTYLWRVIRNHQVVSPEKEDQLRRFMSDNPEGLTRTRKGMTTRYNTSAGHKESARQRPLDAGMREYTDPCIYCGVRGDVGCKHRASHTYQKRFGE